MKSFAKRLLFPLIPNSILRKLRGRHYLKKFADLTGEEEPEMKIIRELVQPESVVLDVGANFGCYTKFLSSLVGQNGRVHSFEPIPEVFGYLKSNINSERISNVELHNCALSDKSGKAQFSIPKFKHTGENFYEGHLTEGNGDLSVEVNTIDELGISGNISFIKCDVEGAELKVLKGAVNLIKKSKPIWMLEINSDLTSDGAQQIINFMHESGYKMSFVDEDKLVDDSPTNHGVNYFFMPVA